MTHMMAQQQQLAVVDTNHAYLESRANAVDAVQGTIAELGNIFQELTAPSTSPELTLTLTLTLARANPNPHPHSYRHLDPSPQR